MKKASRRTGLTQDVLAQLRQPLAELMRSTLLDTVITAGSLEAIRILEEQRQALCGPRHAQIAGRAAYRHGHCAGSLVMGGRRVTVPRPRARSLDGRELELPAWQQWSHEDPLDERALSQMLLGVSTRGYSRSLEPLPAPLPARGTSRSAVSRRFVRGTQQQLAELLRRDLSGLRLAVLMIDGVHFEDHVVLAALGIEEDGHKHVLGLWEGATENARACKGLLEDLVSRGLDSERALLVVLDGAKGLYKAVRDVFGRRALIQRCQEHKKRNVGDQLPESMRPSVRRAMNEAYESSDAKRALRLLENLAGRLEGDHPGAAASLREGLAETLTVIELGLTGRLRLTLRMRLWRFDRQSAVVDGLRPSVSLFDDATLRLEPALPFTAVKARSPSRSRFRPFRCTLCMDAASLAGVPYGLTRGVAQTRRPTRCIRCSLESSSSVSWSVSRGNAAHLDPSPRG